MKEKHLEMAINWAKKRATISLKSISEGYEDPTICINKDTKEEVQADVSFVTHGGAKHYSVIALKDENPKKIVSKWKLLSFLAAMKSGKLHLLTPTGHKAFTERLVNKHNINAVIHPL